MPLTPEGVRTWKFGTTRFRRGYDQQEVDAFLELVEEELVDRDIQTEQVRETRWFDSSPELPAEPSRQTGTGQVSGPSAAEGTTTAAAFQLQMAAESSASTIAEARQEADRILSRARPDAERAAAGSDPSAPAPAPTPVWPPDPGERQGRAHSIAPVNAVAFGPHGPGQGDNPHGAWLAIDGQRRTAWHTRRYTTARFGSLYPGTGLLIDMGNTVTITAVRVTLGAATGASFQICIGNQPMLADLRPAASSAGPGGVVRMTLGRPVRGRYVAVWFTRLPPGPAGTYQAAVYGIGVKALGLRGLLRPELPSAAAALREAQVGAVFRYQGMGFVAP